MPSAGPLAQDRNGDLADAIDAGGDCRGDGEVDHATVGVGTAVVDAHDGSTARTGDLHAGTEGKGAVGRGHLGGAVRLATCSFLTNERAAIDRGLAAFDIAGRR